MTAAFYAPVELAFDGPAVPIPADRIPLVAVFRGNDDDREHRIAGFWDGGTRVVVRFAPEHEGRWCGGGPRAGKPFLIALQITRMD